MGTAEDNSVRPHSFKPLEIVLYNHDRNRVVPPDKAVFHKRDKKRAILLIDAYFVI